MKDNSFYITVPIFYPNAELHLGNAYPVIVADILARYNRLAGKEVFYLVGSDENTGKVSKAAAEKRIEPKVYLEDVVGSFKTLFSQLNISYDEFIRTSDEKKHWPGAIALWNKLIEKGDIEKRKYKGLYCAACEAFYTEKDLIDGKCPNHYTVPEEIEEENYFFLLSKYTFLIKEKIESGEMEILPATRKNEILSVLKDGLQDISFSRPKNKVPWGIPVPGDGSQVMYVWCDALSNYISALGYGRDDENFQKFWPVDAHVLGKDILRFHAAIWPAMLLSAGLPLPKRLIVHGLILSGGKKMSKSLGNSISPKELIDEYGAEALRFYAAKEISLFEDGELTKESFKAAYNAGLANGLGNLVSRVMKMAEVNLNGPVEISENTLSQDWVDALESFDINKTANITWKLIQNIDQKIQETQPFKLVKTDREAGVKIITELVQGVYTIARMLNPILPQTSEKVKTLVKENKAPEVQLFARKD